MCPEVNEVSPVLVCQLEDLNLESFEEDIIIDSVPFSFPGSNREEIEELFTNYANSNLLPGWLPSIETHIVLHWGEYLHSGWNYCFDCCVAIGRDNRDIVLEENEFVDYDLTNHIVESFVFHGECYHVPTEEFFHWLASNVFYCRRCNKYPCEQLLSLNNIGTYCEFCFNSCDDHDEIVIESFCQLIS